MNIDVAGGRRRPLLLLALLLSWTAAIPVSVRAQSWVEVMTPEPTRLARTLDLVGSVTAAQDAALSPRVSGLVQAVKVDAGDVVRRGQVLLEIDPTMAQLALRRADAAVLEGRTQVQEARRLRDEARALSERGDVPQSQYRTREAQASLAEATLARLDAERQEQAEIVARHAMPAPFDGVIRRRLTDPGEWVQTGTAVLELVATAGARIDVQVPQRYLPMLDAQTPVEVRLDANPERAINGRIGARVPTPDPGTRTFLVRVALPQDVTDASPGMSARLRFELSRDTPALRIERDAIKRYPDGTTTVWTVEGDGEERPVREIPVTLAEGSGPHATVIDGLRPDQPVVIRGNESLRADQTVRIRNRP